MLLEFHKLQRKHPQEQVVTGNLAYLKKREEQTNTRPFKLKDGRSGVGSWRAGTSWWWKPA